MISLGYENRSRYALSNLIFSRFQADSELTDLGEDNSLCSICPRSLLDDEALALQFSLTVPANEDLHIPELTGEASALFENLYDTLSKQCETRSPVTLPAKMATKPLSHQSVPRKKLKCSLAEYACPETNEDAFSELTDLGEDSSLHSICPESLFDDEALTSQFSLSVSTNEDLHIPELTREAPVLLENLYDILFKQHDIRSSANQHAEATAKPLSHQSVSYKKLECSLAGYRYPEANHGLGVTVIISNRGVGYSQFTWSEASAGKNSTISNKSWEELCKKRIFALAASALSTKLLVYKLQKRVLQRLSLFADINPFFQSNRTADGCSSYSDTSGISFYGEKPGPDHHNNLEQATNELSPNASKSAEKVLTLFSTFLQILQQMYEEMNASEDLREQRCGNALDYNFRGAFLEQSDIGEDSSFRSISLESLLDVQVLESQVNLSVPTDEFVSEFARAEPALFHSVCDVIFKQHDFRPPVNLHAETTVKQNKQLSLQSMPTERMECSLAGYWCQETNVSSFQFYFQGFLGAFVVQRYSAATTIRSAYWHEDVCVCLYICTFCHSLPNGGPEKPRTLKFRGYVLNRCVTLPL
ncbi:unnamed protein product [Gongylonema pulchrum]|uniref:Uncharacterized protein n=1 Tax=Gongylonema pulchrum TaxID=637853 RepID=A0A183CUQ0_9BILA|nr:unnamed protein product [Gongylonema pulchrum]